MLDDPVKPEELDRRFAFGRTGLTRLTVAPNLARNVAKGGIGDKYVACR